MERKRISKEELDVLEEKYKELLLLRKTSSENHLHMKQEFKSIQRKLKYYGRLEYKEKIVSLMDLNSYQDKYNTMNNTCELFELERQYNELKVSGAIYKTVPSNSLEKKMYKLYHKIYKKRRKLELQK